MDLDSHTPSLYILCSSGNHRMTIERPTSLDQ
jgi:hypothetical protein